MFQRRTLAAPAKRNEALPLTQYCKRILFIIKSCKAEEAVGWRTRVQYYSRRSRVMLHPVLFILIGEQWLRSTTVPGGYDSLRFTKAKDPFLKRVLERGSGKSGKNVRRCREIADIVLTFQLLKKLELEEHAQISRHDLAFQLLTSHSICFWF